VVIDLQAEAIARAPVRAQAPLVSVVIPTLNEAENLRHLIPALSPEYELVIVDGGSTDGTVELALELCPDAVIERQPGQGKGDALIHGFMAARGDIIVAFDGDCSARADEIPRFVHALAGGAHFAKGSRFIGDGGSADLTRLRSLGNRFLCGLVNMLHGTAYTDLCYGFNAFSRECLPFIPDDAPGFEIETTMNIRIAHADLRIVEVPSYEDPRRFGSSNLRAFRDGFKILGVILRERRPRSERAALEPELVAAEVLAEPELVAAEALAEPALVAAGTEELAETA
jgi:glycosyltransferase involved in cell wall biosynthesis